MGSTIYTCCKSEALCMNTNSMKLMKAVKLSKGVNDGLILIQVYDVEREIGFEHPAEFRLLKDIKCFGQLVKDNILYMCGIDNLNRDVNNGSYFCKFELPHQKVDMLISSTFSHYKPSMISYKLDDILVIGGKGCVKCEKFMISLPRWDKLPDLPESRYGSNLVADEENDIIYLFGGLCEETGNLCGSVLRLSMKSQFTWDTLLFKDANELLKRAFSAVCKVDNNIYILGGKNKISEQTDDVIEVYLPNRTVKERTKLHHSAAFTLQKGVEFCNNLYYFNNSDTPAVYRFDKYNQIDVLEFAG